MKSISGQNVLTVLLAKEHERSMRMFFCPYTKNVTTQYKGKVNAILPGFNPDEDTLVMIRPQRMEYGYNIQYSFKETEQDKTDIPTVDFWIQDQYFVDQVIRTYHCYNCQAPNLYFAGNKTVMFSNKSDVVKGTSFDCINPLCKERYTYHGIVKITEVSDQLS